MLYIYPAIIFKVESKVTDLENVVALTKGKELNKKAFIYNHLYLKGIQACKYIMELSQSYLHL